MKNKNIITSILLSLVVIVLFSLNKMYEKQYNYAEDAYLVYLNGEKIGLINNEEKLYSIINEEQEELKKTYNVNTIYPPNGFNLVKVNTFDDNYISENEVYQKVAKSDDFTIKGYIITIKYKEKVNEDDGSIEKKDNITINVLDKEIFEQAIEKFILAFISESDLTAYLNNETGEITDIGSVIKDMYFDESITIKEGYISSKSKIFTSVDDLSQYLLFGPDAKMTNYTVKLGDDIESISEDHKLNPQEFIIANPIYRNEKSILTVGATVNVTVLNPVLTYIYEVDQIEEVTVPYNRTQVVDKTKPVGYSEVTRSGVSGLTRNYENFKITNGEQDQEVTIVSSEVLREKVDQITTVGPRRVSNSGSGNQVIWEGDWTWPTNEPAIITSKYKWRSLNGVSKLHEGIDISGTGYGSPIYAIGDGTVVITQRAQPRGGLRWSNGTYVVIRHENNLYSAYLHLSDYNVSVGQTVKKGQRIASMGNSGYATGTHLHLGLFIGQPYSGQNSQSVNPQKVIPAFNR